MKKALLFGNYTNYEYHPLSGVDEELKAILQPDFQLTATESDDVFCHKTLADIDLLILYGDRWNTMINSHHMAALISYVCKGGALLVIHNGISFQDNFEFMQMIGGRFDYHPDIQPLTFHAVNNHPVMEGFNKMVLNDEPYRFEFCPHTKRNVFLEYEMEGTRYPAGWSVQYCLGRIVYLMPGHTVETFQNDAYRRMLLVAGKWVVGSGSGL